MEFTIRNATVQRGAPPTSVARVIALLNDLPNGELLTYIEIAARMGRHQRTVISAKGHPAMASYWVRSTHDQQCPDRVLLANRRTIRAYKKEFGE